MFLRAFYCTVLLLTAWVAHAAPVALIPMRVGNTFGYCNASMQLCITPRFQDASPFQDERAVAKYAGRYGVIDTTGKWLIPPLYDEVTLGPLILLKKGNLLGIADRSGCLHTECIFDEIYVLKNAYLLLVQAGRKGIADPTGKILVPTQYDHVSQLRDDQGNYVDLFAYREDGLMGLYDACGNMVQRPRYARIDVFQEGLAVVQVGNQFGMIDLEGKLHIHCEYDQLHGMSEGMVAAKLQNRWGFLDKEGREVIPFLYEAVQEGGFFKGRASVNKAGNWVFVQRNGEVEFPLDNGYQSLGSLSEGLVPVCKLSEEGGVKYGYVDPLGRQKIPFRFERADAFSRGFAIVGLRTGDNQSMVKEMRYGVIDRNGRTIVPIGLHSQTQARLKRDSLGHLGFTTLGFKGRNCRVDYRGRRFGCEADHIGNIQQAWISTRCERSKMVAVAKDGLWGFCDARGKLIIPCQFANVDCFQEGLAKVWSSTDKDVFFYIDEQGKRYYIPQPS